MQNQKQQSIPGLDSSAGGNGSSQGSTGPSGGSQDLVACWREEVDDLQEALSNTERACASLRIDNNALSEQLLGLERKLQSNAEQSTSEKQVLHDENMARKKKLDKLDIELRFKKREVDSCQKEIAMYESKIIPLQEAFLAKKARLEKMETTNKLLTSELEEKDKLLKETKDGLRESLDEVERLKTQLAKKDRMWNTLVCEIERVGDPGLLRMLNGAPLPMEMDADELERELYADSDLEYPQRSREEKRPTHAKHRISPKIVAPTREEGELPSDSGAEEQDRALAEERSAISASIDQIMWSSTPQSQRLSLAPESDIESIMPSPRVDDSKLFSVLKASGRSRIVESPMIETIPLFCAEPKKEKRRKDRRSRSASYSRSRSRSHSRSRTSRSRSGSYSRSRTRYSSDSRSRSRRSRSRSRSRRRTRSRTRTPDVYYQKCNFDSEYDHSVKYSSRSRSRSRSDSRVGRSSKRRKRSRSTSVSRSGSRTTYQRSTSRSRSRSKSKSRRKRRSKSRSRSRSRSHRSPSPVPEKSKSRTKVTARSKSKSKSPKTTRVVTMTQKSPPVKSSRKKEERHRTIEDENVEPKKKKREVSTDEMPRPKSKSPKLKTSQESNIETKSSRKKSKKKLIDIEAADTRASSLEPGEISNDDSDRKRPNPEPIPEPSRPKKSKRSKQEPSVTSMSIIDEASSDDDADVFQTKERVARYRAALEDADSISKLQKLTKPPKKQFKDPKERIQELLKRAQAKLTGDPPKDEVDGAATTSEDAPPPVVKEVDHSSDASSVSEIEATCEPKPAGNVSSSDSSDSKSDSPNKSVVESTLSPQKQYITEIVLPPNTPPSAENSPPKKKKKSHEEPETEVPKKTKRKKALLETPPRIHPPVAAKPPLEKNSVPLDQGALEWQRRAQEWTQWNSFWQKHSQQQQEYQSWYHHHHYYHGHSPYYPPPNYSQPPPPLPGVPPHVPPPIGGAHVPPPVGVPLGPPPSMYSQPPPSYEAAVEGTHDMHAFATSTKHDIIDREEPSPPGAEDAPAVTSTESEITDSAVPQQSHTIMDTDTALKSMSDARMPLSPAAVAEDHSGPSSPPSVSVAEVTSTVVPTNEPEDIIETALSADNQFAEMAS